MVVKPSSLSSSFIASALVHCAGLALAVGLRTQQSYRGEGNPVPVSLLESVLEKPSASVEQKISRAAVKEPPQAPAKHETARASYRPMALRMGMESDVMLRIEVDPQGNVTRGEIIKSGGAGFDKEALTAVQQSRFEPAQRDGQNVAAEFSYIYRFRLQR